MLRAGFVHRDVSAGNCLFDPKTQLGKIADLEYAKHYDDIQVTAVKTVCLFDAMCVCVHVADYR